MLPHALMFISFGLNTEVNGTTLMFISFGLNTDELMEPSLYNYNIAVLSCVFSFNKKLLKKIILNAKEGSSMHIFF